MVRRMLPSLGGSRFPNYLCLHLILPNLMKSAIIGFHHFLSYWTDPFAKSTME